MKQSVYDLAFDFVETFYGEKECPTSIKLELLEFMDELLYDGFTAEEITQRLTQAATQHPNKMPKLPALFSKGPKTHNLLKPGKFYCHNLIQIIPGPPVRDLDLNTGEIRKLDEEYFLEMRASLTIEQAVQYYAGQFGRRLHDHDQRRYVGVFKYLLGQFEIEHLLFMIDVAANLAYAEDMGVIEPIQLKDYAKQAEEARMAKLTEITEAGVNVVVPRRRVLRSRRRREKTRR